VSRIRAFFLEEAAECLRVARSELDREGAERGAVHRAVRRLRGSAELARFTGIATRARALEARLRDAPGGASWPPDLRAAAAEGIDWLEGALEDVRSGAMEPENQREKPMEGEVRAGDVVGIEELEYRGNAALERAIELRAFLEDAIESGGTVTPLMDELFDLIRLGMK
jgi:HPt (histidine-containing phosphotransfer) domain-containing protein